MRRTIEQSLPKLKGPKKICAELRYLYALLVFSDADPVAETMEYRRLSECAVVEYSRDGVNYRLVIAEIPDAHRDNGLKNGATKHSSRRS